MEQNKGYLSQEQVNIMNQFYQDIVKIEEDESLSPKERYSLGVDLRTRIEESGDFSKSEKSNILERIGEVFIREEISEHLNDETMSDEGHYDDLYHT